MSSSSSSSPISSSVRADLLKMFFKLLVMISSSSALAIPAKFPISWTDQVPVPLCIAAAGALVSGFVFLICFRDHGEEEVEVEEEEVEEEEEEDSEKSRKVSASAENDESSATTQKAEDEQMMMFEEKIQSPSLVEMREKTEEPLSDFASPEVKQTMNYSPDMGSSVTEADKPKVARRSGRKSMSSIVLSDEASIDSSTNSTEVMSLRRSSRIRNRMMMSPPSNRRMVAAM